MQKATELIEIAAGLKARLAASPRIAPGAIEKRPEVGCDLGQDCPICGGSGYYRLNVPVYDDRFGKLFHCPNVNVWKINGAEHYGLYPDELAGLTWESVKPLYEGKAMAAANVVREIVQQGHGWVYLYGDHGQAKSLILKIAVAEYLKQNKQAAYANMADVISHLQMAFDSDNPNSESQARLQFWAGLPLLALDEFNRFNKTQWASTSQFRLMDQRNVEAIREQSITLIASNQPPDDLDGYYRSRILDGRFITIALYGPDARPIMNQGDRF